MAVEFLKQSSLIEKPTNKSIQSISRNSQHKTKNLILRVHTTPNISNTMNITHFNQPSQIFFGFVGVKVKIDSGTFVFNKTGKFFKNSWEFRNDDNDSIHIQSNVLNLKTKSKHLHACSTIGNKGFYSFYYFLDGDPDSWNWWGLVIQLSLIWLMEDDCDLDHDLFLAPHHAHHF